MEGNVYWITRFILDIPVSSSAILWIIKEKVKALIHHDAQ